MASFKVTITGKYLKLPVNNRSVSKMFRFLQNGKQIFDFYTKADPVNPSYYTYTDLSRFLGEEFEIVVDPEAKIPFEFTDVVPKPSYREPYRPRVHFTPRQGWMNDPNGLVFTNGIYHLSFQHNPSSNEWGNMTWGHAVSNDLLHWEELDCILFPDELGSMFSGSAVYDERNVSGFGKDGICPIVYFYTAAGGCNEISKGQPFTQCVAYSLDGGKTVTKYEKNPIIKNVADGNRDPKVNWCEELGCYIMALYLIDHRTALYTSDNLLDWTMLEEVVLPEDEECPDCFSLKTPEGGRKWLCSAAHGCYCIGAFENGHYVKQSEAKHFNYGNGSYAAQIFSGTGDRRIRIEWGTVECPGEAFQSQTGFPKDLSLGRDPDGELRLQAAFSEETRALETRSESLKNLRVSKNAPFRRELAVGASRISLRTPFNGKGISVSLFGITIAFDFEKGIAKAWDHEAPLFRKPSGHDYFDAEIVFDACGAELLLDQGTIFFSFGAPWDASIPFLKVEPLGDETALDSFRYAELASIWD